MAVKTGTRTKGFSLTPNALSAVDRALSDYKTANPGAVDADALLAFISAYDQDRKTSLVPGSSDALRSFDMHMTAARNEIVTLTQEIVDARDKAQLEVQGKMDKLRDRQGVLTDSLQAEQARVTKLEKELASVKEQLGAERNRADKAEAERDAAVARAKQMDAIYQYVTMASERLGVETEVSDS